MYVDNSSNGRIEIRVDPEGFGEKKVIWEVLATVWLTRVNVFSNL